jgi:predicted MFS family arabinose efflux permease
VSPRTRAVAIFLAFAAAYFLSYALRAINAAIAPNLVLDLGLKNAQLGALTSAYFFSFALLQLPLGFWLDRFGPRIVEMLLLVVAVVGALLFAFADSVGMLWLGRALIGVGVSACLMAALKGFRLWFPDHLQARLAAWMMTMGTMGVVSTTLPAQWAAQAYGWRPLFVFTAVLLALAALAIALVLPSPAPAAAASNAVPQEKPPGVSLFLRDPYFWRIALLGVIPLGAFIGMQTLWVGPWLHQVSGFTPEQTAQRLLVINAFLMAGYLVLGYVAPRFNLTGPSFARNASITNVPLILVLVALSLTGGPSSWWLWVVYAFAAGFNNLALTHVSLTYPVSLSGRVLSAFNFLTFAGAFAFQWGMGVVIDAFQAGGMTTPQAFRATLWCVVATQVACWLAVVFWPQPKRIAQL